MLPMTTVQAQRQKLPGHDTYRRSHIAYLDDHHRDWNAVYLNTEAIRAFSDTIVISERRSLAAHRIEIADWIAKGALAAGLAFPWNAAWHDTMEYVNYENLKIASGFELHLKSRLLASGFLLHNIDPNSPPHAVLAREQKKRPVHRDELLSVSAFHFDGSLNYLPGLLPSSLKFSWLTDRPGYRTASGLGERELNVIRDFRELRNQIHLPGDIVETPALQSLGERTIEFLLPFINREIVRWSNSLIAARSFTFPALPEYH